MFCIVYKQQLPVNRKFAFQISPPTVALDVRFSLAGKEMIVTQEICKLDLSLKLEIEWAA